MSLVPLDGHEPAITPNVNLAARTVEIALSGCAEYQRTLLRLVYLDEEPIREVARSLNVSVDALHHRLSRARGAALRALRSSTQKSATAIPSKQP